MKRTITLLALCLTALAGARAQSPAAPCGTEQEWKKLVAEDPASQQRRDALDEWTRQYLANPAARSTQDEDSVLVIPVVVHVMHNFGAENISHAQVEDALRIVNEYYSKQYADTALISDTFKPLAANSRLEFRLARLDPSGNCTIGVTRTITPLTIEGDNRLKSLVRWPNDRYLNVWVCNLIASGAAAYAVYPGANPSVDGIVCRSDYFGSIGTAAGNGYGRRTLTHEIGHWLNLRHTWGNSNESGLPGNCGIDDGVADTPNTIGTDDQGCDLNKHTCGEVMPDNVENIMDYSGCRRMFTLGQKARMRAAAYSATGGRSTLWSVANLVATGTHTRTPAPACSPSITLPTFSYKVCPGQEVRFNASIDNAPADQVNYLWEFPGSTTPTSAVANPDVVYAAPGIYPVRLRVSNAAGADSVVVDSSVVVRNLNSRYAPGDSETFAGPDFPLVSDTASHFWEFENTDGRKGWVRHTTIGVGDQASLQSNLRVLNTGNTYSAITPGFDLRNLPRQTWLVYRYASAKRVSNAADEFAVYASNNCGENWNVLVRRTAAGTPNVYTQAAPFTGVFMPAASEFVEQRISLHNYAGRTNVRFKFEATVGGGGNAIFLDNVHVTFLTAVTDRALLDDVQLAPNPTSNLLSVTLPSWPESRPVRYSMLSPLGQQVMAGRADRNHFTLDVSALPAGVYMLQLEGQKLQRVVIE